MLGVLKAGGVYVPLDPQAPADRVGYIIGNCGVRILITNSDKRAALECRKRWACSNAAFSPRVTGDGSDLIAWSELGEFPGDARSGRQPD